MNVSEGSPETMSSSPVKGCWGLASGGGVSDLSSDSGWGTYGPGLKFIDRDNLGPGRGDKEEGYKIGSEYGGGGGAYSF